MPRWSTRRVLALAAFALLGAACAQPSLTEAGDGDLAAPADGSTDGPVDLQGADLAGADLAQTMCDPVAQTGCGASDKCTLSSSGPVCEANGTRQNGQDCGGPSEDCVKGTLCTIESTTLDQCRAFCATDTDCKQPAPAGTPAGNVPHCVITLTGTPYKVCTVACNPVAAVGASGCAAGLACQIYRTPAIVQGSDCAAPGAGGDNADCTANDDADCAPGFGCITDQTMSRRCRQICRANTNADCTVGGGYTCVMPADATMWGFCLPP